MDSVAQIKGRLIVVEGTDGSGKSTQAHLLYEWLLGLNCKVFFSEWNSSAIVKGATRKGKKRQALTPTTFSAIHATDFADRYERQILPMLKAGYIVICDRYIFTAFARDSVRGCNLEWLKKLYSFALIPHITFFYKVPLEVACERILSGRPQLKFFEAGMDLNLSNDIAESFRIFQGRILKEYLALSKQYKFTVVDGTKDVHYQQTLARKIVEEKIELSHFRKRATQ
ncbi:MAG: dTMP kinase [Acidobacteriota bacterium]|nr:dTMP kinase [Thermoanaerobaculaceae bacterium]